MDEEVTQGQTAPETQVVEVPDATQGSDDASNGTGEAGGNPAWASILEAVPTSLHPILTPKLQEWDRGVQQRFESIKNQYKPWEDLISSVDDPQVAASGIQLLQALESNPEGFWKALGESYNFTPAQTAAIEQAVANEAAGEEIDPFDARVGKIEEAVGKLAQMLLNERQAEQQQAHITQLESALSSLAEKHGDFDKEWVLTRIAAGDSPEDAVSKYQAAINARAEQLASRSTAAPAILGSGGGVPPNTVNPAELDSKGTKDLVVQMLRAASQPS